MAFMKAKEIARSWRSNRQACLRTLKESMDANLSGEPGGVRPDEFSIRDLACHLYMDRNGNSLGPSFVEEFMDPNREGKNITFLEAQGAVDSSAFTGIMGQIVYSKIMEPFQAEDLIASKLITTVQTKLNGEKIPGVAPLKAPRRDDSNTDTGTDPTVVRESEPFQYLGMSEEYLLTPQTDKRALGVAVTKEAIFFDRTNLVLQRAGTVGDLLSLGKEKRILDVAIGAVNNYYEKRAGMSAPVLRRTFYGIGDSSPPWINHFDNDALVDWTSIEYAEAKFADMTDPNTGEPIAIRGGLLLTPQGKAGVIRRIQMATSTWVNTVASANVANVPTNTGNFPNVITIGANPVDNLIEMVQSSRQLRARLVTALSLTAAQADGYWFYGDFKRAFNYFENWPVTVIQAPPNSEAEFNQDIVARFKASERGVAAVVEPRYWQRHRSVSTSSSGA